MSTNLYETDFYAWTVEQSQFLKAGAWENLDIINLTEEIESLGKQQLRELEHHLGILLGHLLKWDYQSSCRNKVWQVTIREQRREINYLLKDSPSLKPYLPEAITEAYLSGIDLALRETDLDDQDLPAVCPYTSEQIFDPNFPATLTQARP
ncbi:DUF29 domain-containing protein [Pseudocalidococcus azoricus]|uniref:DUF29 domain-containing protein n=1 Tax=Pseudocalidococcus azoricus TaxID=3110322 RepID=UPI00389A753F